MRFEEDDEDEDLDSLDGEESYDDVVLGYRDLLCREIVVELVSLTTDEMLDFLSWELDRYGFSDKTELELISIEFDKQYILGFWNLREEAEVRTATGAGNMHCFIDTWVLKNLSELIMDKLYGQLADLELVQWKADKKIPLIDAAKGSEDDDEPTEELEPD